jgi:acetyl esterase/lipase
VKGEIMTILAYVLSGLSLLMGVLFHIQPKTFMVKTFALIPVLAAGALSPYWAIIGAAGAVIGWIYQAYWAIPMGFLGAGMMIWFVWRCTRDHKGFDKAFGAGWSNQILPEQAKHMVQKRWTWFLKMKTSPEPSWERDTPFWTVPDYERDLLCDIWSPANRDVSGLAFVFLHGSAWYMGDKDLFSRPFFNHLVAQGHTVMDVAYRLCPEVDIYGMIGDVKHAIAWMKANASRYGVDPEKIVLGGGSAGGHLALLAGYTPEQPEFTPEDLRDADLSVCGIISLYGQTDLLAEYEYLGLQKIHTGLPPVPTGPDTTLGSRDFGRMDILLGGHPEDAPHLYELASPITHVHPDSPPTLLIQGDKDLMIPVDATRAHYEKLVESSVPAINVVIPWANHAFDLLFPQISPPAQSALYDVDRFLALMVNKN